MRRAIKVWGAIMKDGTSITEDTDNVVSVTCHPDRSVTTTDQNNEQKIWEGEWISYNPRYN
ncbi:MAG: hypothetical protein HN842_00570 [Gammaproteobacteria bacterium]|jgi:hypothetical protein|nr:hypothetical protein [Gammaproteobacteria bacterium]MBT7306675.1 hypothetical protein [Gammaproteobacteria bacterium]